MRSMQSHPWWPEAPLKLSRQAIFDVTISSLR
jgi:hypothetical protein